MTNTTSNSVDFEHPKYITHKAQVKICNDCYNGIDTVRQYLTARVNENDTDFANRQTKAIFSNYVERIVITQAGTIFSKPVTYDEITDKTISLLDDLDIAEFAKDSTQRALRDGKSYILVDMGLDGSDPYFTHIDRALLTNWRKDIEGNFTLAVIAEAYAVEDGFAITYELQYRVIREDGNIEIWRKVDKTGWEIHETITTSYNFVPLYELDISDVPPLYDIATVNINHFNAFSEKDSIISTSTQPSFFTKGLGIGDEEQLKIGVNYTINTDNDEADVKWIELGGQSIPFAQDDLDRKEKIMADRALQVQSESAKAQTATQVSIENSESTSRLSDIAQDLQNTINRAYNAWHLMKYNQEAIGTIQIPMDFKAETVDSNIVIGLNNLVVAGNLSKRTMLEALAKHEIIILESVDDELERIDEEFIPMDEAVAG